MLEQHLEKLIVFVGVVDAGSIRKYALSRRISQPGVSQRIASLEKQIGLPLLTRSRSGIELTKHGKAIYQLGIRLVEQSHAAEIELYSENKRDVEITFSTYDSIAIYLMPNVINELQRKLPHVRLKLQCDRSSSILRNLEEGLIDCGLCMLTRKSKRIEAIELYDDKYGFYKISNVTSSDNFITVIDAQDNSGKNIGNYIKSFGLSKSHVLSVPSFEVAKAMTVSGLGIGILPNRVAARDISSGILKRVSLQSTVAQSFGPHSFGFVRRKGIPESTEMRILREIIESQKTLAELNDN